MAELWQNYGRITGRIMAELSAELWQNYRQNYGRIMAELSAELWQMLENAGGCRCFQELMTIRYQFVIVLIIIKHQLTYGRYEGQTDSSEEGECLRRWCITNTTKRLTNHGSICPEE